MEDISSAKWQHCADQRGALSETEFAEDWVPSLELADEALIIRLSDDRNHLNSDLRRQPPAFNAFREPDFNIQVSMIFEGRNGDFGIRDRRRYSASIFHLPDPTSGFVCCQIFLCSLSGIQLFGKVWAGSTMEWRVGLHLPVSEGRDTCCSTQDRSDSISSEIQ
jgi:hypothetical protein